MVIPLQIDEALVQEALALSHHPTVTGLLEDALREYIQRRQQLKVVELFGTVDYEEEYRQRGSAGGQIWMSPDFDEPLEASLQDRMQHEAKGKSPTYNVIGKPEAETVQSVFEFLGRMSWGSFGTW